MEHLESFLEYERYVLSIAYRMLGSIVDAEDLVQETYLQFSKIPIDTIVSPKKILATIVTRLAMNKYRKEKIRREDYKGVWLPEPILVDSKYDPLLVYEKSETISIAFLYALERLNPKERAVFLLRDVFDYEYSEIGEIIQQSETNCRKLASRARLAIKDSSPKYKVNELEHKKILILFMDTIRKGDYQNLINKLTDDIKLYTDAGGTARAALKPIHTIKKVTQFLIGVSKKPYNQNVTPKFIEINHEPALAFYSGDQLKSISQFTINEHGIQNIFIWINPRKINHLKIENPNMRSNWDILKFYLFAKWFPK